jgi:hypothetical protein
MSRNMNHWRAAVNTKMDLRVPVDIRMSLRDWQLLKKSSTPWNYL